MFHAKKCANKNCPHKESDIKFNEDLDGFPWRDDPYDGYCSDCREKAEKRKGVNPGVRSPKTR